jgi:hypothetical protein
MYHVALGACASNNSGSRTDRGRDFEHSGDLVQERVEKCYDWGVRETDLRLTSSQSELAWISFQVEPGA